MELIPRFTAEASLYRKDELYPLVWDGDNSTSLILAQDVCSDRCQLCWDRCYEYGCGTAQKQRCVAICESCDLTVPPVQPDPPRCYCSDRTWRTPNECVVNGERWCCNNPDGTGTCVQA